MIDSHLKELDLVLEWLNVYIQIATNKHIQHYKTVVPPSFKYFVETYDDVVYSLVITHLKEVGDQNVRNGRGMNYWNGVKYYI